MTYFTNLRHGEAGRGGWGVLEKWPIQVQVNIPYRADRILIVSLKGRDRGAGHQIHGGKT